MASDVNAAAFSAFNFDANHKPNKDFSAFNFDAHSFSIDSKNQLNGRRRRDDEDSQLQQQRPSPQPQRSRDLWGRHRLSAAITRLDKEIESLLKELEEVGTMEPSSAACKQVISSTERVPDALLPVTRGPADTAWDRWFQRIRSSRGGHKWYSFKGNNPR